MATLTKKQRAALESVLYHLNRASKYVREDSTVLGRKTALCSDGLGSNGLVYVAPSDRTNGIVSVNKEIGSDITGLYQAASDLERFLFPTE